VVSRAAQTGPGQKAAAVCLRVLPPRTRERVRGRLLAPPTRQPGAVHAPDVHSGVTVSSDKARRTIGYEPRFDFADGMVPTSRYLREYVEQDPAV
jgi:nucleoside-diphosphate-sugar epimerase